MDKKIEVSVEKILKIEAELVQLGFLPESRIRTILREEFPEAFPSEKHWAINTLDNVIKEALTHTFFATAVELYKVRSAFNDDGTLKDEHEGE